MLAVHGRHLNILLLVSSCRPDRRSHAAKAVSQYPSVFLLRKSPSSAPFSQLGVCRRATRMGGACILTCLRAYTTTVPTHLMHMLHRLVRQLSVVIYQHLLPTYLTVGYVSGNGARPPPPPPSCSMHCIETTSKRTHAPHLQLFSFPSLSSFYL
jgi:hypothetical protein